MTKRAFIPLAALFALAIVLPACESTPDISPEEASDSIAAHLAAGETKEADAIYAGVGGEARYRDMIYSVVYSRASKGYQASDYEASSTMLRFLTRHYPQATAPREGLLYSLALHRAQQGKAPDASRLDEMDRLAQDVRKRDKDAPAWVDLVAVQVAIDRNHMQAARSSFARFRARWDGKPKALQEYVTQLDRFLSAGAES